MSGEDRAEPPAYPSGAPTEDRGLRLRRRRARPVAIDVITPAELDADLQQTWRRLQASNPEVASPFFCPELTLEVSTVRSDVEVAVLREAGEVVGFFPFQRGRRGHASPVGGGLSDHHGVITDGRLEVDVVALLEGCRLRSFRFHHLLGSHHGWDPRASARQSPLIDVSGGAEAWLADRRARQPKAFKQLPRNLRRLGEWGPVRYERHVADPAILETLLGWKSAQYGRSNAHDAFSVGWTVELMQRLQQRQGPTFAGRLSVLWVGDEVAAAHMGLVSDRVWHYWFPAYGERWAKHSPGLVLLLEMALDAGNGGVAAIDLGPGDSLYKRQFSNASVAVLEGFAGDPGVVARAGRRLGPPTSRAGDVIRRTPLVAPLRLPSRVVRKQLMRRHLG